MPPRHTSHNRTKCHRASLAGHREADSQTHNTGSTTTLKQRVCPPPTPPPTRPPFYSGRAAPAFLPACRAESCLYRAFPTTTATTTHVPIRLTGPVTPLNAKPHGKLARGPGRPDTQATLTLTPDLPRFTITEWGQGGCLWRSPWPR